MKQHYELLYILPISIEENKILAMQESVKKVLSDAGAEITLETNLGKKKLAYPIKRERHGTYVAVEFNLETQVLSDIDRLLRLQADIIRFLVIQKPIKSEKQLKAEQAAIDRMAAHRKAREAKADKVLKESKIEKTEDVKPIKVKELLKEHEAPKKETAKPIETEDTKKRLEELDKKLDEIMDDNML